MRTLRPGTSLAVPPAMRAFAVVMVLGACAGSGSGSGVGVVRPAVTPKLSELPVERERRDAVLDSAGTHAGPEHRRGQTVKERKAETTAATAAAVLGWILSDNENVVLGGGTAFDESWIVDQPPPPGRVTTEPAPDEEKREATQLVPWVRLGPDGKPDAPPPAAPAPPAPAR